jgi:hypothetical protein
VDISRRTSLDSPLPVQVLEASPKGHYTQLVVQPLGWYDEPLTVVLSGDDAPYRGERLFVGCKMRLYNGNERSSRAGSLLWRSRPDTYSVYRRWATFPGGTYHASCRPGKRRPAFLLSKNREYTRTHHRQHPLVKLQRMGPDNGSEIWVKLEGNNRRVR